MTWCDWKAGKWASVIGASRINSWMSAAEWKDEAESREVLIKYPLIASGKDWISFHFPSSAEKKTFNMVAQLGQTINKGAYFPSFLQRGYHQTKNLDKMHPLSFKQASRIELSL